MIKLIMWYPYPLGFSVPPFHQGPGLGSFAPSASSFKPWAGYNKPPFEGDLFGIFSENDSHFFPFSFYDNKFSFFTIYIYFIQKGFPSVEEHTVPFWPRTPPCIFGMTGFKRPFQSYNPLLSVKSSYPPRNQ